MYPETQVRLVGSLLIGVLGCAGAPDRLLNPAVISHARPAAAEIAPVGSPLALQQAEPPRSQSAQRYAGHHPSGWSLLADQNRGVQPDTAAEPARAADGSPTAPPKADQVRTVSHDRERLPFTTAVQHAAHATHGGVHHVELVSQSSTKESTKVADTKPATTATDLLTAPTPPPLEFPMENAEEAVASHQRADIADDVIQLNLPTALAMVGGQHPAVGLAQWRVQEAYAQLDQARVLWLPSIQAGTSFHRHDGNYQASDGAIVDVNRSSLQYGLGAGATGAGTTNTRPGIVAQFHLADALLQPAIARTTAWARGHAADGVVNQQLLHVALGWLELLTAEQDLRILEETRDRTAGLAKLTSSFASAGQGLQADADRLQTELTLVDNRVAAGRERVEVASARLAEVISLKERRRIVLLDPTAVPIDLVPLELDRSALIRTGLSTRPELK